MFVLPCKPRLLAVLAIGGVGGLAVGLAGREILENLFTGLIILSSNPFEVGNLLLLQRWRCPLQPMQLSLVCSCLAPVEDFPFLALTAFPHLGDEVPSSGRLCSPRPLALFSDCLHLSLLAPRRWATRCCSGHPAAR